MTPSARARAIVLLAQLIDREQEHRLADDVADVVDALIAAARAPESDHTRAVERELGPHESRHAFDAAAQRVNERVRKEDDAE